MRLRPTADRVRESLFNILSTDVRGAVVLDLFAGTGALAIEAISRGGASAVLVDAHGESVAVIRKNLSACAIADRAQVIRWDIEKNLHCLQSRQPSFDLVFMDPPYARGLIRPALENIHRSRCLAPAARLVIEHAGDDPLPELSAAYALEDQRRYGKTLVSFLSHMV